MAKFSISSTFKYMSMTLSKFSKARLLSIFEMLSLFHIETLYPLKSESIFFLLSNPWPPLF